MDISLDIAQSGEHPTNDTGPRFNSQFIATYFLLLSVLIQLYWYLIALYLAFVADRNRDFTGHFLVLVLES
jgi:hypothetical protein